MAFGKLIQGKIKIVILFLAVGIMAPLGHDDIIGSLTSAMGDRDTLVRWSGVLAGAARVATPVTVIDFDDQTLAAIGAPGRVPRDRLADLIGLVTSKTPLGIFVDLDMSRAGPVAEADRRLQDAVAAYPPAAPMLAFARRFVDRAAQGTQTSTSTSTSTELGLVALPTILDEAMRGRVNVMTLTSATQRDSDRVVRRWQLTQSACRGTSGVTYASPQLVAAALTLMPTEPLPVLDRYLDWQTQRQCAKTAAAPPAWPRNAAQDAAIWFVKGSDEEAAPVLMHDAQGRAMPLVQRISASSLLTKDGAIVASRGVSNALFDGRFVVIGSSHVDSFDTHMTPLGSMPGVLIVANAIATAPATLSAPALPPWLKYLSALAIFVALALATSRLRGIVAGLLVGVVTLALLALLGRLLVPSNALEIVLTAIAMLALYAGFESIAEIIHALWKGKGWRAFQKPAAAIAEERGE